MKKQEEQKTNGAGMRSTQNTERKNSLKKRFSARKLALMAMFVALSYAVSFLEIPLFPTAPFLKLDFGNVFILLIAFLLGPVEGVIVCVLKEMLRCIGSGSTGVGEIANTLVTSAYILFPAIMYRFHKGIKTVVWCLVVACFIGTGVALIANRFIMFPLYENFLGVDAETAFASFFWIIVAFNLIKSSLVGLLTMLLYKRLSNFLKKVKI